MRKLVSQFCKALAVFAIFLSQCSMTPTIKNEGAKSLANYIKDLGYTKFKVYLSRTRLGHIIDESNQLTGAKIVTGKLVIHNTNQSMKLSYNTSNYAGLGADIPILGSAKIDYSSIYKIDVELVNIKKYELDSKKLNPSYASIESYRKKPFIVSLLFAEKILVRAYSQVGGKLKLEPKLLSSVNLRRDKSGTSLIGARNAFIGYITQKEVGDIRHVSLLKSHDPLNEQPGGAPGWISGAIGINKQGKRKYISCVAQGQGLSQESAKGIAQVNGYSEMAMSAMAIVSVQLKRGLEERTEANQSSQLKVFQKMSEIRLDRIKISGVIPHGQYWRMIQRPQDSEPMYEYYILYKWDYKDYKKTRKRILSKLMKKLNDKEKKMVKKASKIFKKLDKKKTVDKINLNLVES